LKKIQFLDERFIKGRANVDRPFEHGKQIMLLGKSILHTHKKDSKRIWKQYSQLKDRQTNNDRVVYLFMQSIKRQANNQRRGRASLARKPPHDAKRPS